MQTYQRPEPLWAIQLINHVPSGIVGRGAQIKLKESDVAQLRAGELPVEALVGTVETPGPVRRALHSILPPICLNPDCEVSIVLQDGKGVAFVPTAKKSARDLAEEAFKKP